MKSKSEKGKDSNEFNFDVDLNEFVGYDSVHSVSKIYHIEKYNDKSIIFPEKNPFYYEAGGQISDKGTIHYDDKTYDVLDVYQASNGATGLIVDINDLTLGQEIELEVNKSFRSGVSKSHTGAHIVHTSLRNILGDHVAQAGSNVTPGKFRFDFSHTDKVSDEELDEIFKLSNNAIFECSVIGDPIHTWDLDDGTIITPDTAVIHTYSQNGVYEVVLSLNNNGCVRQIVLDSIEVYGPDASFSPLAIAPICHTDSILFEATNRQKCDITR